MSYFVYILRCADDTLYTGYTTDIERRLIAHNESKLGAKYTSGRRPAVLAYSEEFETKSEALKREIAIKKMSRKEKLSLIIPDQMHDFYGIPYLVVASKKRKRSIGFRITNTRLEVRVPLKFDDKKLVPLLEHRKDWIEKNWQKIQKKIEKPTLESGLKAEKPFILYFGEKYPIYTEENFENLLELAFGKMTSGQLIDSCLHSSPRLRTTSRRNDKMGRREKTKHCVFDGEILRIYMKTGEESGVGVKVHKIVLSWYKKEALSYLQKRTKELAKLHSFTQLGDIFVKSYKAKYGMCKGKDVYLDYKLITYPKGIIDHIILHELTHLIYKHHQSTFREKLASLDPHFKEHKDYLKGKDLEC